jgi:polysaccharide export outer membrane protein
MKKYILILFVLIGLSSCYTRYSNNLLQERTNLPQYNQMVYEDYKLQINDEIVMRILSATPSVNAMFPSNIENSYRIYDDGTVDFPFIDRVPLLGKTLKEAEEYVELRLKPYTNSNIKVRLALKTNTYCVIGDAGRGIFPIYKERLTIYQAIAQFGGIHESAVFGKVKIIRTTETGTIIKQFDIRTKSIINSEFYYIHPNDIIYADLSKKSFWASGSYSEFVGVISSSLTFLLSVWNWLE